MQSGIHQRSKQRCQEKCWKVQGRRGNCNSVFFFFGVHTLGMITKPKRFDWLVL